jgi:18S rRNA (guanine1575-N7)-methyltransferase
LTYSFGVTLLTNDIFSISVLQWLLNAETSHPTSSPPHRLTRFFTTLHSALKNPSRAIFQFYPTSDDQIQLITSIAQKAGFGGGIVVDYPNSKKARKVFLCLFVGQQKQQKLPEGLDGEEEEQEAKVRFERRREREKTRSKGKRKSVKDRDWILKKKEVCEHCRVIGAQPDGAFCSYTGSGGRTVSQTTQNTPAARGKHTSRFGLPKMCTMHYISHAALQVPQRPTHLPT